MPEPIRMSYRLETRADQARTWRALSDTDAFNRVAQANFTYKAEQGADGVSRTIGTVKKLGLSIRFHEEPFSFRAPHWFRVHRVFESGPAKTITAIAQLGPRPGGGTTIAYDLEVVPRTALFRPILNFDLKRTTEKYVGAALSALVQTLEEDESEDRERALLGPPPALSAKQAARLEELATRLSPSPLVQRLCSFLRAAPERDQVTMSALSLSQAWLASLDEVVALFIAAAKIGILGARIDLLCPSCLVPRAEVGADGPPSNVHCETCRIPLDASFPESLAVHFFPNPEIRTLRVKIECLGSPSRTPQIVAQETVAPGDQADLTMALEPGPHQVRTMPARGPAALVVAGDGERGNEASFILTASIQPQLVHIRPEPRAIQFRNESNERVTVVVEKLVPPRRVLTLGRLLAEFPELAEVVPTRGFISTMACFVANGLALRAPSPDEAAAVARVLGGARVAYASDCIILALYAELDALFADLAKLDLSRVLAGMAVGNAFENVVGGRSIPMGPVVDAAYAALGSSYPGRVAAPHEAFIPEVKAAAERARWTARTAPYGPRIAWLERVP
jgi:hypothetical protein